MPITLDGTNGITTPTYGGADTSEYLVPVTQFKNRIINGSMMIDQRNAGASVTVTTGQYPVDRFLCARDTAGATCTAQRSTIAPTGFINSLLWTTTTGATSGANDESIIWQNIEGFNVADLGWGTANAKTVTLSFWVRSSLTGTFGVSFRSPSGSRNYVGSYTINSANTFEYKTVTVAGDTTGTWATDNSTGLRITWDMGCGTSKSTTAGSWGAGNLPGLTGGVKVSQNTGATFYITGVQLEVGSTATSFDYRPYGTELQLCQRYFETSYAAGTAIGSATQTGIIWTSQAQYTTTSYIGMSYTWKVQKRAAPTVTAYDKAGTSGKTTRWTLGSSETDGSNYSLSGASDSTWQFFSDGTSNSAGLKLHFAATAEL